MSSLAPLTGAAVSTALIMYPIDVLRALKMASATGEAFTISEFYAKNGLKGFVSQGVVPEICRASAMRVSKFFFFPIMCNLFWGSTPSDTSPLKKGIAGAFATVPEILVISPMEVAKIGLQLDREGKFNNNPKAFAKHIYEQRGIRGLYCGWAGMQYRQSLWTGTYFATLQSWRDTLNPILIEKGFGDKTCNMMSGFAAGYVAAIPNTPGDVVRSVVQKRCFTDPEFKAYGVHPYAFVKHAKVAGEIIAEKGVIGLWSGFSFKGLHLGGSGALMATFIPIFKDMLGVEYAGV